MAKDKAAKERAREQKRKEGRIRDQRRREEANRLRGSAMKALFMGDAKALAEINSRRDTASASVIPVPEHYSDFLVALAPLKEQLDHIAVTAAQLSRHMQGEELDAWHTLCMRFTIKKVGAAAGDEYLLDLLATPRCAFAQATDPFGIARERMREARADYCGFVTCVMSAGQAPPVWCVFCTDAEGRMAAWTIDHRTWYPASVVERLLQAANVPSDAPLAESEALDRLLEEFDYPTDVPGGIDFAHPAARSALEALEKAVFWHFERYRTMSSIAEGFLRGGLAAAMHASGMIADREQDVRKLRGETVRLQQHASTLQATRAAPPAVSPAGPSLQRRLADLFAPA